MRTLRLLPLLALLLTAVHLWSEEPATPQDNADAGMVHIGDFAIDVYEFPNRKGVSPTVDITWSRARDLCRDQGKRLCTDSEWERACRGPENYLYGYSDTFESGRCNTPYKENDIWRRDAVAPSGTFAQCHSSHGVYDMIGNVWEWTDGWYDRAKGWRVVRGGSWFNSVNLARADERYGRLLDADFHLDLVGFRCCRSLAPAGE